MLHTNRIQIYDALLETKTSAQAYFKEQPLAPSNENNH